MRSRTASRTRASWQFDDDGERTFYATYTAYSGRAIRSELLETRDFRSFRMSPLTGHGRRATRAWRLFPRKIGGKYAMIARQDNENLYLIYSDDLYHWDGGTADPQAAVPVGVRADRQLRLADRARRGLAAADPRRRAGAPVLRSARCCSTRPIPSKVLARSREPLVRPEPSDREGYVPNVVYTCGGMRHDGRIVLPYAVSDTFSNFATIEIPALLGILSS